MSNRDDWKELVEEIMDIYSLANHWPQGIKAPLMERLETELHNAFIAGQEFESRGVAELHSEMKRKMNSWLSLADNAPSLNHFIDEIRDLRAFKEEWDTNDGNSPGYNLQKARNYGKQAAIFKSLYLAWRKTSMTLKPLTTISVHGSGNIAFAAARRLEKESTNEWPEIFPEQIMKDPVNKMDPIEEANKRAQEEVNIGADSPFHDKYFMGKTPVCDLTTEQLEAEVARRKSEGPFEKMFVMVRVIGTLANGERKNCLHWEYDNIDPKSFASSYNQEFMDLKVKRIRK